MTRVPNGGIKTQNLLLCVCASFIITSIIADEVKETRNLF